MASNAFIIMYLSLSLSLSPTKHELTREIRTSVSLSICLNQGWEGEERVLRPVERSARRCRPHYQREGIEFDLYTYYCSHRDAV